MRERANELDVEGWSKAKDLNRSLLLAQIEVMVRRRWEQGKIISKEMGISFAPDGYSHFKLTDKDEQVLNEYFDMHSKLDELRKYLHINCPVGLHVETFCNVVHFIKNPELLA